MTSRQQIPDSILRAIQEVANDKERGASSISQQALRTLVTAADQIQAGEVAEYLTQMRLIAEALRRARPAMAPVRYWVTRFERTALDLNRSFSSVDTARQFVSNVARALLVDAEAAQVEAARRAASQLDRFRRLATCSWSGTVIEFFNIAAQRQPDVSVTVLESQPGTSAAYGARAAQHLRTLGITVEMKASPDEVARASEAVVLGADTILADGSVVNGVPSRALAQAARDTEKPVFIVAEIAKIDFDLEIAPVELEAGFEVVPAAHITAIITEQGAIAPNAIRNLAR